MQLHPQSLRAGPALRLQSALIYELEERGEEKERLLFLLERMKIFLFFSFFQGAEKCAKLPDLLNFKKRYSKSISIDVA